MKQVRFDQTGLPEEVVYCADVPEPVVASDDDVLVAIDAFQINPADLLTLQGIYPQAGLIEGSLGTEATGVVEAVGASVSTVSPGDRVIMLTVDNWSEKRLVKSHEVVRLNDRLDRSDLAGLKVNPATAAFILKNFVKLQPEDWVLQNAANSAVGRAMIIIARSNGLRTINIVRSEASRTDLESTGAQNVLIDDEGLSARVDAATEGRSVPLAVDAVSGEASQRMGDCLGEAGMLVVYGAMSGQPAVVNPAALVFNDIRIRGFWLSRFILTSSHSDLSGFYTTLSEHLERGEKFSAVDSVYPINDIKGAVARAARTSGGHKVIVTIE